ncbi:YkvA family protein [Frigoriflavimonas asaccharolytica]|uniref:Uncharacterized membrane protein YkvA (DUF1232 family) n=1 Tax=Frigoriflavimonas asaccharolytica TaxID=2735899 RepID=A0A8J8G946_9FLAO|nr:DUF1232 domain-containing protein [Frigoriflavimonas asaccharolytica]NRS92960.1 uncharacterized membrane protein YkvA (DUF1232 family) [Frigoriflavimonas asaccharolytica]
MKYSKIHIAKEAIKHKGFLKKVPDIYRMLKMWRNGTYKMKTLDIILPLLGFLYVLSPIDLLPEMMIPVLGLADDFAVLALVIPKLIKEVDKFLLWEAENRIKQNQIVDAEIVS